MTEGGRAGAAEPAGMRRLLQDSSLYLIGNVAGLGAGFLALPFYTRFLSPAQYGVIELVELSTQTLTLVFGLQAIGLVLGRLYHDQPSAAAERTVVSTLLLVAATVSAAVTGVGVAAARPLSIAVFGTAEWTGLMRLAFVAMFFGSMAEVSLVYERIRSRARFFVAYSMVSLVATLGLNILFIGFLDAGVWGFVASKLIVTSVGCTVLVVRTRREVGWGWNGSLLPALLRMGGPLVVSGVAYFAVHYSDRFFLSHSVSLADIGRYALSYRFAFLVSAVVGDSFVKGWDVTLYRYTDRPAWRQDFARVAAYFTFTVALAGMGIALFGPEVLRIMVPAGFLPLFWVLPTIVAAYVLREVGDFFRSLLLINRRAVMVGKLAVGAALLNLVANAVLVPAYGVYGAASATLVTWLAYMLVCWAVVNREHRLPVDAWAFARLCALLAGTYAAAVATRVDSLFGQIVLDGVWSAVFAGAAFLVYLDPAERAGMVEFGRAGVAHVAARVAARR